MNNIHVLIMLLLSVYIFSQGLYILLKYRGSESLLFSILIITTSFWTLLNSLTQTSFFSVGTLGIITKLIYYVGTIISAEFYLFCISFTNNFNKNKLFITIIICIATLPFFIFTDLIIGKYYETSMNYYWVHGKFIFGFLIEFYYFIIVGFINLLKFYFKNRNYEKKSNNILNIIVLFISGFIPPSIFSIILPIFGYYKFDWISVIFIPVWFILIWFLIIKKNIFEIGINIIELGIYLLFFSFFSIILIIKTKTEFLIYLLGITIYGILSLFLLKIYKERREREKLIKKLSEKIL